MINNYLFRLLFDYRGEISHREYMAGFVVALMCIATALSNSYGYLGLSSILLIITRSGAYDYVSFPVLLLKGSFPIAIPFNLIALYIVVNLSIKRCRTISFPRFAGIGMGIVMYLLLPTIYLIIGKLLGNGSNYSQEDTLTTWIVIGAILLFLVLLILGVSNSKYTDYDTVKDEEYIDSDFNSIRCLIRIGAFNIYLCLANILTIFLITNGIFDYIRLIFSILTIIGIIFYFYIVIRRGRDAGINTAVIIVAIVAFILILSGIVFLSLMDRDHTEIYNIAFNILIMIYQIGCFVFIALPSKDLYSEESITDN